MEHGRIREQEIVVSKGKMLSTQYFVVVDLEFMGVTILKKIKLEKILSDGVPFHNGFGAPSEDVYCEKD